MRKTLLTLVAVLLSFSAYGADIFENWEEKSSFGPATNGGTSAVKGKSPLTDIEYSFVRACKSVPGQATIPAFLSIANRAGAYVEFALPINCKEIKIKTTSNIASTCKINVLAGGLQLNRHMPLARLTRNIQLPFLKNTARLVLSIALPVMPGTIFLLASPILKMPLRNRRVLLCLTA